MRLIISLCVLALLSTSISVARGDDAAKKELDALKGTWAIVSAERDGMVVTDTTVTLTFDGGGKVTVKRGEKLIFEGTAVLDASKSPKTVDITQESEGDPKGKTIPGIYELSGDMLKVCSGKQRPTDFTAGAGSGRFLRIYKRAAK